MTSFYASVSQLESCNGQNKCHLHVNKICNIRENELHIKCKTLIQTKNFKWLQLCLCPQFRKEPKMFSVMNTDLHSGTSFTHD